MRRYVMAERCACGRRSARLLSPDEPRGSDGSPVLYCDCGAIRRGLPPRSGRFHVGCDAGEARL